MSGQARGFQADIYMYVCMCCDLYVTVQNTCWNKNNVVFSIYKNMLIDFAMLYSIIKIKVLCFKTLCLFNSFNENVCDHTLLRTL